jgi:hypothetical protein
LLQVLQDKRGTSLAAQRLELSLSGLVLASPPSTSSNDVFLLFDNKQAVSPPPRSQRRAAR